MAAIANRVIFPSPQPSYTAQDFRQHLCWIPWNRDICGTLGDDPVAAGGIPCLWLPAARAANVMLYLHGNAEDMGMSFSFLQHMRNQFKVNVLAVEYPGYGLLNGLPSSEKTVNDVVLTIFRFLVDDMRVRYDRIYVFGRSIGSGPAVKIASSFPIGGLILVSAFVSIKGAVESIAGPAAAMFFRERFPNAALIKNVQCPTLFIHGEKDTLIPATHSLELFRKCRGRKVFITPPRMDHNSNLWMDAQFLAVPAINFFGLPGFCTDNPPKMPAALFEAPHMHRSLGSGFFWLCGAPQTKLLTHPKNPMPKTSTSEWSVSDQSTGDASEGESVEGEIPAVAGNKWAIPA